MTEPRQETHIPWIGQLPESWAVATLKRTTYLKGRIGWQGLTTDEYLPDGDYLLVTGTDFEAGQVQWSRCPHVDAERYAEDPYIQLRENDLLITKDGTIGKVAIVRDMPKPATLNSGVFVTRPLKARYRQDFLYWVLVSDVFPEFIAFSMVGTTINHLYQKTFERFVYPLPALPEQQRIAAYLDASCAAIDAAVVAKRRQLETLDALRRTAIQDSVTKGLDPNVEMVDFGIDWLPEIPKHWKKAQLKRHAQMIRGQFSHRPRSDPAFYDGPYPFIQTGSISAADKFITEFTQTLNEDGLRISRLFPKDTVVMTITGAKIAEVAVTTFEACFPDSIVGFVPDHRLNRDYLYYLLIAMKPALLRAMVVTTQPNINYVQIGGNYIPLPPVGEQQLIASHIEQRLQGITEIRHSLETQIATLTAYRKSLIHECVTGQRRVTEEDVRRAGRSEKSLPMERRA